MENEIVSIIVPIYNAEKYLENCIESIVNQTYKNIEILLINDGSSDDSLQICMKYKEIDHRIIVINKKNEGVSIARNIGIDIASGDYIGFVDSDDEIRENLYETLMKKIKNENSDLCTLVNYTVNKRDKAISSDTIGGKKALEELLLFKFPTSLWAYLYSKKLIKDIRLKGQIHFFEDFEFNVRVLAKSNTVSLCYENLYNYNINETSINSQNIDGKRMSCLEIKSELKKILFDEEELIKEKGIYSYCYFYIVIIASISKTPNCKKKYYKEVKKNIKKDLIQIIFSNIIPIKYKILCVGFILLPKLFAKLLYFLKYSKAK